MERVFFQLLNGDEIREGGRKGDKEGEGWREFIVVYGKDVTRPLGSSMDEVMKEVKIKMG